MSDERVLVVSRRDENGFAMIVSMVVATVAIVLVTAILAQGVHLLEATTYDRKWNNSLQVAEAGVEATVVELIRDPTDTGLGLTTAPFGQFETTVSTPSVGYRLITSTGYSPSKVAAKAVKRRIEVRYGPAPAFSYALFSASTMELKNVNNNCVTGDAFANEYVAVNANACLKGSVISATGAVEFDNNGQIKKKADGTGGNVYSGGFKTGQDWGISIANGVVIEGSAYAQQEICPTTQPTKFDIVGGGTINGEAFAGDTISAGVSVPPGNRNPNVCQVRRATQPLPTFQVGQIQNLYGVPVTEYTTVAAFNAANPGNLSGYHYVKDPVASNVINLTGRTVTDTFVLITDNLIDFDLNFTVDMAVNTPDKFVDIISLNSSTTPPAINIKNGFDVLGTPKPPVLLYSMGYIEVKNSAISNGAIYGNPVNIKNNLEMTYDARVQRVLGFGPSRFERLAWTEVTAT